MRLNKSGLSLFLALSMVTGTISIGAATPAFAQDSGLLSTVQPYQTSSYYWAFVNKTDSRQGGGNSMTMGGVKYENGFKFGDPASASFNLDGKYTKLSGLIGLDDAYNSEDTSVAFIADGKTIAVIEIKAKSLPKPFEVDLTGVKSLELKKGAGYSEIDFANPMLSTDPNPNHVSVAITDTPYLLDVVKPYDVGRYYWTFDAATLSKLGGENSMTMAGQKYYNGFKFGEPSYAIFNLQKGYSKLTGTIGLDDYENKKPVIVKFIGDDKLLQSINLAAQSMPQSFEVNLTGVAQLKIEKGDGYSEVDFAEVKLSKAGQSTPSISPTAPTATTPANGQTTVPPVTHPSIPPVTGTESKVDATQVVTPTTPAVSEPIAITSQEMALEAFKNGGTVFEIDYKNKALTLWGEYNAARYGFNESVNSYKVLKPGIYKIAGKKGAVKSTSIELTDKTIKIMPQNLVLNIAKSQPLSWQIATLMIGAENNAGYYELTAPDKKVYELSYSRYESTCTVANASANDVLMNERGTYNFLDRDNTYLPVFMSGTYKVIGNGLKTKEIKLIADKKLKDKLLLVNPLNKKSVQLPKQIDNGQFFEAAVAELLALSGDGNKAYSLIHIGEREPVTAMRHKDIYNGKALSNVRTFKASELIKNGLIPLPSNVKDGESIPLCYAGNKEQYVYVVKGKNVDVYTFKTEQEAMDYWGMLQMRKILK